jgi:N-methylhydantoinase A
MLSGPDLTADRIAAAVAEMRASASAARDVDGPKSADIEGFSAHQHRGLEGARAEVVYGMRYSGQAFELPVPGTPEPDPTDLIARFESAHEDRYGHRDPDGEVVLVDIRLALIIDGPDPRPAAASEGKVEESTRRVRFADEWIDTPVLRGEPEAGRTASGPAVFELPEATLILPPTWNASVDEFGSILATRQQGDSGDPERTSPQFVREGSPESPSPEETE